ncbi:MAG: CinA family protein [Desulfovibrionaceae bacterium]
MPSRQPCPSSRNFYQDLEAELCILGQKLSTRGLQCATAESCTGGLVGATLTSISGASQWFVGGIIAYDNRIKTTLLRVPAACIDVHGAVSREVVCHMAQGACKLLHVPIAVAISGVAGPDGGTPEKPVGTVWLGFCVQGVTSSQCLHLEGDRQRIRRQTVALVVSALVTKLG